MNTKSERRISPGPDWWIDFYNHFSLVFELYSPKQTRKDIGFLKERLGLRKGAKVLDCPCGNGRVTIPLARAGCKVTGVDVTDSFLRVMEKKAAKHKLPVKLVHSDMRRIAFEAEFDAVLNLWTSFGYFQKESDNLLVLKRFYRALKPGGRLALHLINRDWLMTNFEPSGWGEYRGVKVLEKREFDYTTSTSLTTWTFIDGSEERSFDTAIRMYSYHELIAMLKSAGFENINGFSNTTGDRIDRASRMMYIFAHKRAF